jgi:hypothetical protein
LKSNWLFILCGSACLLTVQLMCERARAENLQDLMRTRSRTELARVRAQDDKKQQKGLICQTQLKERRIPIGCFEEPSADHENLDPLCLDRAQSSTRLEELEAALRSSSLPKDCKKAVQARRSDLLYQQRDGPNLE